MSGETKGTRERIDQMVSMMVNKGVNPSYAKEKARKCAIKEDRKNSNKSKQ